VTEFEVALAKQLQVSDPACVVTTNSGTSALQLALHLVGVAQRNVITTPMTFVATTTAICQAGGRPLWADVVPGTCQMDPESVKGRLLAAPKAILPVAWAGFCPDLHQLQAIGWTEELPIILDAAQAFGATFKGDPLHVWADFTVYSFAPTKHLTTGDGGALICANRAYADRARRLAWFGMRRDLQAGERVASDQDILESGFKYHMNNLTAALGLAGLHDVGAALNLCRAHARAYREAFAPSVRLEPLLSPQVPSPYTFTIFVKDPRSFSDYMQGLGISALQPHRRTDDNSFVAAYARSLPNVTWAQQHYVSLPVGWWLRSKDIDHVIEAVLAFPDTLLPEEAL